MSSQRTSMSSGSSSKKDVAKRTWDGPLFPVLYSGATTLASATASSIVGGRTRT